MSILQNNIYFVFNFWHNYMPMKCLGQVVSYRINASVYETLKENKKKLIKSDYLIIDTRNFADNIRYTLVDRKYNVMNTYFGAQVFENGSLIQFNKWYLDVFKEQA